MAIGINTPYAALKALRTATASANQASERISTGLRINSASDDPAGLVRANNLAVEIGAYTQVKTNIASALTQVERVNDSLTSMASILASMKTLALASSTETDSTVLADNATAFDSYMADLKTIAESTTINGTSVLDDDSASYAIQVGTGSSTYDTKTLTFWDVTPDGGLTTSDGGSTNISSLDISTASGASSAYDDLDYAIDTINSHLATVGAYETSLGYLSDFADAMITNTTADYDNVMSADLAQEATNLAAAEILQNSSMAIVAQSNSLSKELVDMLLDSVTD